MLTGSNPPYQWPRYDPRTTEKIPLPPTVNESQIGQIPGRSVEPGAVPQNEIASVFAACRKIAAGIEGDTLDQRRSLIIRKVKKAALGNHHIKTFFNSPVGLHLERLTGGVV